MWSIDNSPDGASPSVTVITEEKRLGGGIRMLVLERNCRAQPPLALRVSSEVNKHCPLERVQK